MKHIAILISPKGEQFYAAYGPMVNKREKALEFKNKAVAEGAARNYFGISNLAFWPSEIIAQNNALKKYVGWTFKTIPV
jgi:hypothetical protein